MPITMIAQKLSHLPTDMNLTCDQLCHSQVLIQWVPFPIQREVGSDQKRHGDEDNQLFCYL